MADHYKYILAIISATLNIYTAYIIFLQFKKNKHPQESLAFILLSISVGLWGAQPLINPYFADYKWYSALVTSAFAIFFTLHLTNVKLNRLFYPITILVNIVVIYFIHAIGASKPEFLIRFIFWVFPLLLLMNSTLFYYYWKHRTIIHLIFATAAMVMIFGGFYDTAKLLYPWPDIPMSTLSSLFFVFANLYNVINRGYLQSEGWTDYLNEIENNQIKLKNQFRLIKKANIESVMVLTQTIEAKDPYTRGHCVRVRNYARQIGRHHNIQKEKLLMLEFGALLHDVGKIGIPGIILNKPGKLNVNEYKEIQKHPVIGENIIKNIDFYEPILKMVRHHHEFFNGKGYPDQLSGDKIPFEARILSIADVYDAISSNRPYRNALPVEKAIDLIKELSGNQLDPAIVEVFLENEIYNINHDTDQLIDFDF